MGCTSDNQAASCVLYTILVSLVNFRFSRKNNGSATMNVLTTVDYYLDLASIKKINLHWNSIVSTPSTFLDSGHLLVCKLRLDNGF